MTNQEKLEVMKSKNPVLSSLVDRLDLVVFDEPIKMPIPGISHNPKCAETSQPLFSIFKEPITNKIPNGEVSLRWRIRMKLYTLFQRKCTPYSGETVHPIPVKLYTP